MGGESRDSVIFKVQNMLNYLESYVYKTLQPFHVINFLENIASKFKDDKDMLQDCPQKLYILIII